MPVKAEQFANALDPNEGGVSAVIDTIVSPVQYWNAAGSIAVTVDGNSILSSAEHLKKHTCPNNLTPSGICICVSEEHRLKLPLPNLVILFGRDTDFSCSFLAKTPI